MDEHVLEEVVKEFYSVSLSKDRTDELHGVMLEAQQSHQAWQYGYSFVNSEKAPEVQLFGINCLYTKLTMPNGAKQVTENPAHFDHLRGFLVDWLNRSFLLSPLMQHKVRSTFAVLILQTIPDIWQDPIGDSLGTIGESVENVLGILAELPTEFRRLPCVVERRNLVRTELYKNAPSIARFCAELVSGSGDAASSRKIVASIECVQAWLKLPGSDLMDWKGLILACLDKGSQIDSSSLKAVAGLLTEVSEKDDLRQMDGFLTELFRFAAHRLRPIIESSNLSELSEDDGLILFKAVVSLAENSCSFIVKQIATNKDDGALQDIQSVILMMLGPYGSPAFFPVDEELSDLPTKFWEALQEDATAISTSRSAENIDRVKEALAPVFRQLLQCLIRKICYPPTVQLRNYSKEDLERFEGYRVDLSDLVYSSQAMLGDEVLSSLLRTLTEAVASSDREQEEGILFAMQSLVDSVSSDDKLVEEFILKVLPQIHADQSHKLANTALTVIDRLTCYIMTSENKEMLVSVAVQFILRFLNMESTAQRATLAMKNMTSERDSILLGASEQIVQVCYACFMNEKIRPADRMRGLLCLGFVISLMSGETVLQTLNSILAPRLDRLKQVCESKNVEGFYGKEDLIFELNVVSTLLGSVENPKFKTSGPSPVFLVLEQSLPLFHSLAEASSKDPEVVSGICDALKKGISAILETCKPLVPQILHLLTRMFPFSANLQTSRPTDPLFFDHNVPVFGPAKQLVLLFGTDKDIAPMICESVLQWSRQAAPLCSADNTDLMEGFMSFAYMLAKKHWLLLAEQPLGKPLVSDLVGIAAMTMEQCQEAPTIKQAAMFLAEVLRHPQSPVTAAATGEYGERLIKICFQRMQCMVLTSTLEYIADVLFVLAQSYPKELRDCLGDVAQQPLVAAMLKEVANKRKFREFAKQINWEFRRNAAQR